MTKVRTQKQDIVSDETFLLTKSKTYLQQFGDMQNEDTIKTINEELLWRHKQLAAASGHGSEIIL